MTDFASWEQGPHHGVVWPDGLALIDSSVEADAIGRIWERLNEVDTLERFLAVLQDTVQVAVTDLPGFAVALASTAGDALLAARGGFVATAPSHAAEAPRVAMGEGVTTWVETRVEDPAVLAVAALSAGQVGVIRPLVAGVVPASALRRTLATTRQAPAGRRIATKPLPVEADPESSTDATDEVEDSDVPAAGRGAGDVTLDPGMRRVEVEPVLAESGAEGLEPAKPAVEDVEPVLPPPAPSPPPASPLVEDEITGGEFADLWGEHTVYRPAEDAAVRPGRVDAPPSAPDRPAEESAPRSADLPEPLPEDVGQDSVDATWGDPEGQRDDSPAVPEEPAAAQEAERPARVDPPPPADEPQPEREPEPGPERTDDVIGSVPSFISGIPSFSSSRPAAQAPRSPVPEPQPSPEVVEPPAAHAPDEPDDSIDDLVAHDGHTVMTAPIEAEVSREESVLAVECAQGHANPPHRAECRWCASPLDGPARRMARPSLGRVISGSGESRELTSTMVIGRAPTAVRFQGPQPPELLPIKESHVSANHLQLRLEGWSVLAQDLQSRNGTMLRRQGQRPVRLLEAAVPLVEGDVLDLGHGIHLTFEGLP